MSENELFDQKPKEEPVTIEVKEPEVKEPEPVKPVKKKRVISDKQRAQLAENLKRGQRDIVEESAGKEGC